MATDLSEREAKAAGSGNAEHAALALLGPLAPVAVLAAVCIAPLAVGAVHRPALTVVVSLALAALLALGAVGLAGGMPLRGARLAMPLLMLLLLPALQTLPLPTGVRARLDPAGSALLENSPHGPPGTFPLSLDPPSTRRELALAAAALAVFLVAVNLSKGRRGMGRVLLRAVAITGAITLAIGVVHRILGLDRVFGVFGPSPGPLVGPFVNPNHLAQFLELAGFTAVALAAAASSRGARIGWLGLAAVLAVGTLLTLSRGAVVALCAGGAVFLALVLLRARRNLEPGAPTPLGRHVLIGTLLGGGLVVGGALALGAGPLIDEFRNLDPGRAGEKTVVWQQSLAVLKAHPLGIGRGAFDEVFPAHRPIGSLVTQDFVENEPLQHLLDLGWPGFAVVLMALGFAMVRFWRRARRDTVEFALVAGLAAVFVHNVFDFGWEILGIRLPVVAVAGVLVGRSLRSGRHEGPSRPLYLHAPAALVLGVLGLVSVWSRAGTDFDQLIREAPASEQRQRAIEAATYHPLDYFFPLIQARTEPVRPDPNGHSARLAALNRAVRLCPTCYAVQGEIAHSLWVMGRRAQAIMQWQIGFDVWSGLVGGALQELVTQGVRPAELARCRPQSKDAAAAIARTLVVMGEERSALDGIDWAERRGVAAVEIALMRGELARRVSKPDVAEREFERALSADARAPGAFLGLAAVAESRGDAERALSLLREGSALNPGHADLASRQVELIMVRGLWEELEPALVDLRRAHDHPETVLAAHLLAARAYEKRGNIQRALQEYRAAAILNPNDATPWRRIGVVAEQAGQYATALDAFREVLRLLPSDPEALRSVVALEARRERGRRETMLVPPQ